MMVVLAYSGHVEGPGQSPLLCNSVGFPTLNAKKACEVVVTMNREQSFELLEVQLPVFLFVFYYSLQKRQNTAM